MQHALSLPALGTSRLMTPVQACQPQRHMRSEHLLCTAFPDAHQAPSQLSAHTASAMASPFAGTDRLETTERPPGHGCSHKVLQLEGATLQVVLHAARRPHDHIAAAPEDALLGPIGAAPVQAHRGQVGRLPDELKVCMHLQEGLGSGTSESMVGRYMPEGIRLGRGIMMQAAALCHCRERRCGWEALWENFQAAELSESPRAGLLAEFTALSCLHEHAQRVQTLTFLSKHLIMIARKESSGLPAWRARGWAPAR